MWPSSVPAFDRFEVGVARAPEDRWPRSVPEVGTRSSPCRRSTMQRLSDRPDTDRLAGTRLAGQWSVLQATEEGDQSVDGGRAWSATISRRWSSVYRSVGRVSWRPDACDAVDRGVGRRLRGRDAFRRLDGLHVVLGTSHECACTSVLSGSEPGRPRPGLSYRRGVPCPEATTGKSGVRCGVRCGILAWVGGGRKRSVVSTGVRAITQLGFWFSLGSALVVRV